MTLAWQLGLGGETCTDKERMWGKGGNVLSHDKLEDISFERPRPLASTDKNKTTGTDRLPLTKQFIDHQDLRNHVENVGVASLWECKGSLLNMVLNPPEIKETCSIVTTHGEHSINCTAPVSTPLSCEQCQSFYNEYINISDEKRKKLELLTQDQNNKL